MAQYIPTKVDSYADVGTELHRIAKRLSQQSLLSGGTTYGNLTSTGTVEADKFKGKATGGTNHFIKQGTAGGPFTSAAIAIGELPAIHNSSQSVVLGAYTGADTTWRCVTNSTLTITTNGSIVVASFTGAFSQANTSTMFLNVMVDSANTAATAITSVAQVGAVATNLNASFSYIITGLSAASHSFCLAHKVDSAVTWALDTTNVSPRFSVYELK